MMLEIPSLNTMPTRFRQRITIMTILPGLVRTFSKAPGGIQSVIILISTAFTSLGSTRAMPTVLNGNTGEDITIP